MLPDTAAVAMSPGSERGASQENRSDIVLENPVSGWAWSEQGWNWLPLDAEQVYEGGTRVWHHTSNAWMLVTGEGLTDLSFSIVAGFQGKGSWKSGGDRLTYEGKRDRDGDLSLIHI